MLLLPKSSLHAGEQKRFYTRCFFRRERLLWNKSTRDKCALCGNRDSTLPTLSGCKVVLELGTWRHDNIIKYIADSVDTVMYSVISDIEGYRKISGGTLDPALETNPHML